MNSFMQTGVPLRLPRLLLPGRAPGCLRSWGRGGEGASVSTASVWFALIFTVCVVCSIPYEYRRPLSPEGVPLCQG